ncbi:MAG: flagellar biosynthetic protein FliO [Gammaproteobacteria bacterium]|nr:flagellar biosynthetic protein FliO [Gammaproteobacteria bacterium]
MKVFFRVFLITIFLFGTIVVFANEENVVKNSSEIPYKQDKSLLVKTGATISVFIVVLILSGLLLFYLNKKKILNLSPESGERNINVLESKRLNSKTIIYLVEVKGKEVLLIQTGNSVDTIRLDSTHDENEL